MKQSALPLAVFTRERAVAVKGAAGSSQSTGLKKQTGRTFSKVDPFPLYLATERLLDFAMKSVTTQERIVLHLFQAFRMRLRVFRGRVSRRRLAFFASFGAFERDDSDFTLLCHYRLSKLQTLRNEWT